MSGKSIERILANLGHSNEDIRERALMNLRNKLDMGLVPVGAFVEEHHRVFAVIMNAFNQLQTKMSEGHVELYLELVSTLISCASGKTIAGQYGMVNYLSQFLGYLSRSKFRKAVDLAEKIITELLREQRMRKGKTIKRRNRQDSPKARAEANSRDNSTVTGSANLK